MASDRASAEPTGRLGDAVRHVREALGAARIEDAAIEARRLVQQACGLAPIVIASEPERVLNADERRAIAAVLERRLRHEPLGRIAGEREFYGRPFRLSPATLEPRPDTETLIDAALAVADAGGGRGSALELLDLGTGTGCILLTLLAEFPGAKGLGTDISPQALATAADNARRLGVASRARFAVGDGARGLSGPFDLVVSNPPYIASGEIAGLAPEVRQYDPKAALDGGADGLDFYRTWIPAAARLAPAGWLLFEVGAGQTDAVAELLRAARNAAPGTVRRWQDLSGHTRVVAIGPQC